MCAGSSKTRRSTSGPTSSATSSASAAARCATHCRPSIKWSPRVGSPTTTRPVPSCSKPSPNATPVAPWPPSPKRCASAATRASSARPSWASCATCCSCRSAPQAPSSPRPSTNRPMCSHLASARPRSRGHSKWSAPPSSTCARLPTRASISRWRSSGSPSLRLTPHSPRSPSGSPTSNVNSPRAIARPRHPPRFGPPPRPRSLRLQFPRPRHPRRPVLRPS